MKSRPVKWVSAFAAAGLLAACASAPINKPDTTLTKAQYAITQAQQDGASQATSKMLYNATQKLDQAKQLAAKKDPKQADYDKARRLADEATADAQLADARAQAKQAQAQAAQAQKSLEALKKALGQQQSQSGGVGNGN